MCMNEEQLEETNIQEYSFNEYSTAATTFANYDDPEYPIFGLVEEVGELIRVIAKAKRGDYEIESARESLLKEAGDVLWMLNEITLMFGMPLEHVARMNIEKLGDRKGRGKIRGSGDSR